MSRVKEVGEGGEREGANMILLYAHSQEDGMKKIVTHGNAEWETEEIRRERWRAVGTEERGGRGIIKINGVEARRMQSARGSTYFIEGSKTACRSLRE